MQTENENQVEVIETKQPRKKGGSSRRSLLFFVLAALVVAQIWSEVRIARLENQLSATQAAVTQQSSIITTMAGQLDYITQIAENANRYAHSHGFGY